MNFDMEFDALHQRICIQQDLLGQEKAHLCQEMTFAEVEVTLAAINRYQAEIKRLTKRSEKIMRGRIAEVMKAEAEAAQRKRRRKR